jgi:copper chaperone CopZ
MKGNERRVESMGSKTQMAVISIGDLTSEAVPKLAQSFKEVPGVESVAFNLELQVASVEFEPQQCSVDTLQRAVLKAGYKLL